MTETQDPRFAHEPVLLDRVAQLTAPLDGWIVDATLGLGGHTERLLRDNPRLSVVGIDRDRQALAAATARLAGFGDRFHGYLGVFDELGDALARFGVAEPQGVLFDLGVSSLQLDSDDRGFAYARDTRLDMRMDPDAPVTAADVINSYDAEELARVFHRYGEERFARRIAAAVVRRRELAPVVSSGQLTEIVEQCVPLPARRRGHPAKRVFQALRIEVNDELGALRRALTAAVHRLSVGGRIVVLSYHSGEDRIVKRAFAAGVNPPVPAGLPVVPDSARPFLAALTRGAEAASEDEIAGNPRAASVRLRAVTKVAAPAATWAVPA